MLRRPRLRKLARAAAFRLCGERWSQSPQLRPRRVRSRRRRRRRRPRHRRRRRRRRPRPLPCPRRRALPTRSPATGCTRPRAVPGPRSRQRPPPLPLQAGSSSQGGLPGLVPRRPAASVRFRRTGRSQGWFGCCGRCLGRSHGPVHGPSAPPRRRALTAGAGAAGAEAEEAAAPLRQLFALPTSRPSAGRRRVPRRRWRPLQRRDGRAPVPSPNPERCWRQRRRRRRNWRQHWQGHWRRCRCGPERATPPLPPAANAPPRRSRGAAGGLSSPPSPAPVPTRARTLPWQSQRGPRARRPAWPAGRAGPPPPPRPAAPCTP
mmetsp:Transcript_334/g.1128  ORF Transcript_334/g.1128 Transcript_334/m.1128 type:complete len:319 (-) Transcript_334:1798-2754(-)